MVYTPVLRIGAKACGFESRSEHYVLVAKLATARVNSHRKVCGFESHRGHFTFLIRLPRKEPKSCADQTEVQMNKAIEYFLEQIRNIRYGTISTSIIDTIRVECYGQKCPLKQIAWTVAEKGRICIDPYDVQLLSAVNSALISEGFNSYIFSKSRVVINLPPISGEDKQKVIRQIGKLAEETKVSIRNIRKNYRQSLTKEEVKEVDKWLQKLTDVKILEIDAAVKSKLESLK